MRRACSSEFRSVRPFDRVRAEAYPRPRVEPRPRRARGGAISASTSAGTSPAIDSPRGDARADRRTTTRACGSISKNVTRSGRREPGEHRLEPRAVDARSRRDAEPRELEDALGLLPARGSPRARRRRSGTQGRRARAPRASRRCARRGRARPRPPRATRTRAARGEADLRRRRDVLVAGSGHDADEQPVEPEPRDCPRGRARRDRRAAGRTPRRSTPSSRLPLELLVADLDERPARRPALAERLLELLLRRCLADDAEAPVGAEDAVRRRSGGRRPVVEELGQLDRLVAPRLGRGGTQGEERALQARRSPSPVAHETRCTARIRGSSTANGAGSGVRSALLRTTICGRSSRPAPYSAELAVDRREPLVGVALGAVDHVDEQPRPLEVGEELVPEADALARTLDQARDVGDRELDAVRRLDGAEHGLERRERVVGDLRASRSRSGAGATTCPRSAARRARRRPRASAGARARAPRRGGRSPRSVAPAASASRSGHCRVHRRRRARRRPVRAGGARSATSTPSSPVTCVPTGHRELDRARRPRRACARRARSRRARPRRASVRAATRGRAATGSATSATSPPRPPSPPSGPPSARTSPDGSSGRRRRRGPSGRRCVARSWNTRARAAAGRVRGQAVSAAAATGDRAALAAAMELDDALAQREERVVATDADARARAEPRAALADDDHPRLDLLAGEDLHARAACSASRGRSSRSRGPSCVPSALRLLAIAASSAAIAPLRLACACSYSSAAASAAGVPAGGGLLQSGHRQLGVTLRQTLRRLGSGSPPSRLRPASLARARPSRRRSTRSRSASATRGNPCGACSRCASCTCRSGSSGPSPARGPSPSRRRSPGAMLRLAVAAGEQHRRRERRAVVERQRSTSSRSPSRTRYCLPPTEMIA